jgi:chromosome segregation ATPase
MGRSLRAHDIMIASGKNDPVDQANATASQAEAGPHRDHSSQGLPAARILAVCPSCKATLSVRQVYVGSAVRCKQCAHQFRVPAPVTSQDTPTEGRTSSGAAADSPGPEVEVGSPRVGADKKARLSQLDQLLARYNELRSTCDQLQVQRDDLIANQEALAANHKSELAAARGELVPLTGQVEQMKSELQAACNARDQLEAERDDLRAKQSELTANHNGELASARAELVPLTQQVEQLKSELQAACNARDQLEAERDDLRAQQSQSIANHNGELASARAELVPLAQQVEQMKSELQAACNARDQREAERDDLRAQQSQSIANHNGELASARAELGPLTQQVEQLKSEYEAVCAARAGLSQQLAECKNDLTLAREGERQLREGNESLVARSARRESEFDVTLNEERAQRQRLAVEVSALHAKLAESALAVDHATFANRSKSKEPDTQASELEAGRTEVEELKCKLDDAEYRYRVMAETLAALGVSVDLKVWHRGNAEIMR